MKLTVKSASSVQLPVGASDFTFFDDDIAGFGLRIRTGGSRTWIYRYRSGKKKQRSITLGNAKAVPLALARENAGRLEAKVRLGEDPALDKQTARIEADNLVGALFDQYLDARTSDWRPSSLRAIRHQLLVYAKPLHGLAVAAVSQQVIAKLLIDVAKASGDVTSNRLRATLATVLGWAIRQGIKLPEGNVAAYTSKRREKTRERVLSDGEIRTLWHALDDYDHGTITKLLLLTGQRRAEIGSLRWDEVHDDFILLSGERTKNKRQHVIPLSQAAKEILSKRRVAGRTYLFGRDIAGFNGWGVPKRRLDKRLAKARTPLKQWTLHDLRRTCVTGMIGLGIQPHVVEAVVNHVGGHRAGVAGIYNRATYDAEKCEALDKWAAHVLGVVGEPPR